MASSGTLVGPGTSATQGNQDGSGAVGATPTGPQGLAAQDQLFQGPAPQGLAGGNPFQGVFGPPPPKAMCGWLRGNVSKLFRLQLDLIIRLHFG